MPVTKISCSVPCSTKVGASLWMGAVCFDTACHVQVLSDHIFIFSPRGHKLKRSMPLTQGSSFIHGLSNDIHDAAKCFSANRDL